MSLRRSGLGFGTSAGGSAGGANICRRMLGRRFAAGSSESLDRPGRSRRRAGRALDGGGTRRDRRALGAGDARSAPLRLSGVEGFRRGPGGAEGSLRRERARRRRAAGREESRGSTIRSHTGSNRRCGDLDARRRSRGGLSLHGEASLGTERVTPGIEGCTIVQLFGQRSSSVLFQRPVSSFSPPQPLHSLSIREGVSSAEAPVSVEQFSSPSSINLTGRIPWTVSTGLEAAGWLQHRFECSLAELCFATRGAGQSDHDRRTEVLFDILRGRLPTSSRTGWSTRRPG